MQHHEPTWDVDYSILPSRYDLRPAVKAIMGAENWLLERMPPNQKLVIVFGESHGSVVPTFLLQALLTAHLEQKSERPFAFGYEYPHNAITYHVPSLSPEDDPDGKIVLREARSIAESHQNFWDQRSLFGFCLQNGISTRFNDIANNPFIGSEPDRFIYNLIDQTDPFSGNLVMEKFPHLQGKEIVRMHEKYGPDLAGIALSNMAIVRNAMDHMEHTQSRIYIQQCGSAHVMGRARKRINHPYEHSLTAEFSYQGCTVLPVFSYYEYDEGTLPPSAQPMLERSIKIKDMEQGDGGVPHSEIYFDVMRRTVSKASEYNF